MSEGLRARFTDDQWKQTMPWFRWIILKIDEYVYDKWMEKDPRFLMMVENLPDKQREQVMRNLGLDKPRFMVPNVITIYHNGEIRFLGLTIRKPKTKERKDEKDDTVDADMPANFK